MHNLGKKIKQLRKSKNLSLRELAKLAHISHSFIADIEAGRSNPSLNTLKSLAKALNVSLSKLLENNPEVENIRKISSNNKRKYDIGDRIKTLRKQKQITQEELAKILGFGKSAISLYESGQRMPDPGTLQKLADFFDVSVDYLLCRTDIKNPYINNEYREKFGITKKDLDQYENFIKHVEAFFMNDEVGEEDKEALFRDISELFWKAKEKNKKGKKRSKTKNKGDG